MSTSGIKVFGVIGAGQMGNGIAQVAAASGLDVIMHDIQPEFTQRGLQVIRKNLARALEKGKLTAEALEATCARIRTTTTLADLARADFVVEAATERADLKCAIFRELDAVCPPAAILATNTSSIPITRLAAATDRPGRFIGMHPLIHCLTRIQQCTHNCTIEHVFNSTQLPRDGHTHLQRWKRK